MVAMFFILKVKFKINKKIILKVFSPQKSRGKTCDLYSSFSLCQKYRRIIKNLYFISSFVTRFD